MSDERSALLDEVIDRRRQVYGEPGETFPRVAQMWSGLIGHEIKAWEVPLMMVAHKMLRTDVMPEYSDNSDDILGYMDIFFELMGPDMIQARSVEEFIKARWPGEGLSVINTPECSE